MCISFRLFIFPDVCFLFQARHRFDHGNYYRSREAAKIARILSFVSIAIGSITIVGVIIALIVTAFPPNNN